MSPNARTGYYLVYLFNAPGTAVFLSLNQATTRFDNGQFIPLADTILHARVEWAREAIAAEGLSTSGLLETIDLRSRGPLGAVYGTGNVYALNYTADHLPTEAEFDADLERLCQLLAAVYRANFAGQPPGEVPAEVEIAEEAAADAAGRRRARSAGFRPNAAQRAAIERRGMTVARQYLESQDWQVRDLSATQPYDYKATRNQEELDVEVKATASDGALVTVTHGEVVHARSVYPRSALIVVSGIRLDKHQAIGGQLRIVQPWQPDETHLRPISYRYEVQEAT